MPMAHTLAGLRFTELALLTLRLNGVLLRAADELVADLGLTGSRWQVLAEIREAPATVAHLARRLGLTRQSVQRSADRLVTDGLARFVANPHHKRSPLLGVTGEGRRVMEAVRRRHAAWANQAAEGLSAADLASTCRLLGAVEARLRDARPESSHRTETRGDSR